METQNTSLDEVLDTFSMVGRYHLKFFFYVFLAFMTNAMYCSNFIFVVEETKYRCKDADFENNSCSSANGTKCSEWIYDNPYSFVAEFELACHNWKRTLVGSTHSFGYMIGLLAVGPLSDRIGRKKALAMTGFMGGVFGLAKSFTYSYWLYIVLEFLESAIGDICSPAYVLNMEIVSAKKRVTYHSVCGIGFIFGGVFLSFSAWRFPYWRIFLRVIYAPALFFIAYIFLLDESPRWLLSKGEKEKALAIIQKMGDTSRIKLDRDTLNKLSVEGKDKGVGLKTFVKMTFQSKVLLKRCMVCIVWWTTSTFVNYGMMINSVSLQGNKYLNYALVSLIGLPGQFIIMYILNNYKRRNPLICSFFAGAVLCVSQPFLPQAYPWFSLTVYMIATLISTFYFSITYMYTSELFPTYTRNSMHALCSSIGRIGSMIAPQTPLLTVYWSGLPSVIFGGMSLLAGLLTFLVPDIANDSLPDTVRQAEALGNTHSSKMKGIDNPAMSKDCVNSGTEGKDTCSKDI